MNGNRTSHGEEPAGVQAQCGTNPPHRILAIDGEIANQAAPRWPLACRADRQKLIEQAKLVLAEARAIAEQSDRSFALPSVERPAEGTSAAASSFQ